MQLKSESRSCAGVQVHTTQLPAMVALPLLGRLLRVGAPAVAASGGLADLRADALEAVIKPTAAVLMRLHPDELVALARETLAGSQAVVDGQLVELSDVNGINAAFSGNILGLLGAMKLAIEVNFGDFFGVALGFLSGLAGATTESESSSTPTS